MHSTLPTPAVKVPDKARPLRQAVPMPEAVANPITSASSTATKTVLIIGGTGVTGRSAVDGLVKAQAPSSNLRLTALTRNSNSPAAAALRAQSVDIITGDLDEPSQLATSLQGVDMVYCHALSTDAASADPAEVRRAQHLAHALASAGVQQLLYNSSAGYGCGYGISQMDQKHRVEDILSSSGVPVTALRATMFMEEFWKRYTRPSIVNKGKFPFSLPHDKKLQLLAAKDIGYIAGEILQNPDPWKGKAIDLAGDELSMGEMTAAFTRHQPAGSPSPVKHQCPPSFLMLFFGLDLWRITRFLNNVGYGADVPALRRQFPDLMTFEQFLTATHWDDSTRTYDSGITYDMQRKTL